MCNYSATRVSVLLDPKAEGRGAGVSPMELGVSYCAVVSSIALLSKQGLSR